MNEKQPILFVEDNPLAIAALTGIMLTLSIPNVHKHNGIDALNYLEEARAHPPGIILFDLYMPVMDGFDFLQRLKANSTWKHIPAIVITGSKSQKDKMAAFSLNVAGYILKPADYTEYTYIIQCIYNYWLISEVHNQKNYKL